MICKNKKQQKKFDYILTNKKFYFIITNSDIKKDIDEKRHHFFYKKEKLKMSEEITIKISAEMLSEEDAKTVTREIDIEINQNDTVNDLIKKIKEHKELVEGQKYLMITFNNKILTSNNNTNLFETLKDLKIGNNSFLKVDLLPPGEDSKPRQPKHWVNISDDIYIKIKKPGGQQKEISLNKNKKCSKLVELIKNDKDITGDYKYFILTFQGKIITASDYKEKTLEELKVEDRWCYKHWFK